ncbi:unnamed protein product [Mytilus coruscus]|uniref:Uncharacterized protein n=1 Tax=Mytilus coruscus TaxID=42192 RepID=A0A6J8E264_MYTCO|nr:unnamed protein product [Mytilus coruscus]
MKAASRFWSLSLNRIGRDEKERNFFGDTKRRQVLFELPDAFQRPTQHQRQYQNNKASDDYAHTIYNLFGNNADRDDQVIYAPGVAAFIRPARLITHERNTVTTHKTEIKSTIGQVESKIVHSEEFSTNTRSKPRIDPRNVKKFGLPEVNLIDNLFNLADSTKENFPAIQSKRNNELMQPLDNTLYNSGLNSNRKNNWKKSFEKRKWIQELQEARNKQIEFQKKQMNTPFGLSPAQELVQQINYKPFMGTKKNVRASQNKQILDMITQGLHPLQEMIMDEKPKQRTQKGTEDEEISEVRGLHSLQAYSKPESLDFSLFNSDLKRPVGSNLLESSANNFLQSMNDLRPNSKVKTIHSDYGSSNNFASQSKNEYGLLQDYKQFVNQLPVTDYLPTKIKEPIFHMFSTENIASPQTSLTIPSNLSDKFGLRNGINNHHNILDYFTGSENGNNNHGLISFESKPKETVSSDFISPPIQSPKLIRHRSSDDKFPININSLPTLELTAHYLPVAIIKAKNSRNSRLQLPAISIPGKIRPGTIKSNALLPWVSNILLPSLSLNKLTEKNIKETASFINMHGRLIDTVTETKSRKQFNFTQRFKPLVKALLAAPVHAAQRSTGAVPLLVSRSRTIPINETRGNRRHQNPHSKFSRRRQQLSNHRAGSLQPWRQRWGQSQRSLVPVNLR